ncbi:DNA primase [Thiomicrospira sp. R3]|uniref:DNA primase n=1 Tax=Thiomicrospira sp. R3 TaxID=3035472 RepID=UPI00259B993F|nr:DNA primase [Thiomicrospira sp. R3]WFE68958.1 DNA primase [Thiomicrospira sp. R3]
MELKGAIPRDFIDSLLARADIVSVINQRVPLKKAGVTFKACCPFHQEKTASFNVNPTKQFYHCFGCGAHGDAITFIMEYEGLTFVEAVESLAAQLGMDVPRQKVTEKQKNQQRQARDHYEVMQAAAKFYRHQLRDHPASEQAKAYLRKRGLSAEIAKRFVIGFAPPGWESLQPGLVADQRLTAQLVELGLLVEKEPNKHYDRFRNRIMFPIRDGRGRVIAFGGRVLSNQDQPKYLNSPETPIFHKSYTLYGLYELRQARQSYQNIIVVEGYMDVVALAQFGIHNVVATLGTATTPDHLNMLFKQIDEIVFCFDGDQAGLKAAWKAAELAIPLMAQTRSVKFLFLAQGEDPDSTVRNEGADGFQHRVEQALTLSVFWLQGLQNQLSNPISTREGRQQLVALAQPYIHLAQGLYQYLLVEAVADAVDLPAWRLEKQMGVRSGFAPFKTPLARKKPADLPSVQQVMTLSKHLACVLLNRPEWAGVMQQVIANALQASLRRDDQFLYGLIAQLAQHYDLNQAVNWLVQAGYGQEYDYIRMRSLPTDEDSLKQYFQESANRLLDELEKKNLLEQGYQHKGLKALQDFMEKKY